MKDFIKKYHEKKVLGNIGIIVASLIMAIGINIFIIDGTEMGTSIKTSVLNSEIKNKEIKADLYLENIGEKIILKNSKEISDMENISLSMTYNPENVSIISIESSIGEIIQLGEQNSGINTFIINTSGEYLKQFSDIAEIKIEKKDQKSEQLNLINANFKDLNQDNYDLSTSGITF